LERKHIIAALALSGALGILIAAPRWPAAIAFAAACALVGFLHWLDRRREDEIAGVREDFDKQLKELKNKLDGVMLRGVTR
jgi:hypothetical protein